MKHNILINQATLVKNRKHPKIQSIEEVAAYLLRAISLAMCIEYADRIESNETNTKAYLNTMGKIATLTQKLNLKQT